MFQTLLKAGADGSGKMVDLIKDSSRQVLWLTLGTLNIADIMMASWRSVSIYFLRIGLTEGQSQKYKR